MLGLLPQIRSHPHLMPSTNNNLSTLSSVAHMVAQTLESYSVDSAAIFKQVDIDLDKLHDPDARIPTVAMQKVWHMAVEATGDPCFGINVAKNIQPTAFHGLGFSWIASSTLRDALERLCRYSKVLVSAGGIVLQEQNEGTYLCLKIPPLYGRLVDASIDAGLGMFVQMCRLTVGSQFSPVRVELQREAPACVDRLLEFFDCPIDFTAAENRIFFSNEVLNKTLATANPALARVNDQVVTEYLARFCHGNITNRVRACIIECLPSGVPTQSLIANTLHVSVRDLQRKLQSEDTNFKQLMNDVRQQLAEQYLKEPHRSIGEITYILGFTEPSNFTRAFKRWTGDNPKAFREYANAI